MKGRGQLGTRRLRFVIFLFVAGTMGFVPGSARALYAQEPPTVDQQTVWDGVYSEAQAERGQLLYTEWCSECHAPDLRGDNTSPSLVGMSFTFLWGGSTLGELFGRIQEGMPPDRPGSLSDQTYRDILAFVLRANMYPTGPEALIPGLLDYILISENTTPQR